MTKASRLLAPAAIVLLIVSCAIFLAPIPQVLAADGEWDIVLAFTTEPPNGSQSLTIGTVIGGSADPLMAGTPDHDALAAPRPPASIAAAWLRTPAGATAFVDRRNVLGPDSGDSTVWSVILSPSDGSGTETAMMISWDSIAAVAHFPADAGITLTGLGPAIDMRAQNTVEIAKGNYVATITVARPGGQPTVPVDGDESDVTDSGGGTSGGDDSGDNANGAVDGADRDADNATAPTVVPSTANPGEDDMMDDVNLTIAPARVLPGQEVAITADICNNSGVPENKTVSLLVDGAIEQSRSISVSAGSCSQVIFRLSRSVPGPYHVAVEGKNGLFTVLAPETVPGIRTVSGTVGFRHDGHHRHHRGSPRPDSCHDPGLSQSIARLCTRPDAALCRAHPQGRAAPAGASP